MTMTIRSCQSLLGHLVLTMNMAHLLESHRAAVPQGRPWSWRNVLAGNGMQCGLAACNADVRLSVERQALPLVDRRRMAAPVPGSCLGFVAPEREKQCVSNLII